MSHLIIVAFINIFLIGCNHSDVDIAPPYVTGNYPLNAHQFGFVAKDNDWLYYIDGENSHNISRTNGIVKETYEKTYARGLNIYGDYIYFSSFTDNEEDSGFYRLHKDKPETMEKILNHHINNPIIVNGYVFYSIFLMDDYIKTDLYRSKVDGSEVTQLEESIISLQWSDGMLYYGVSSGGHVYKMLPSGADKEKLKTKDNMKISSTNFHVVDDWIYFETINDRFKLRYAEDDQTNIFRLSLVDGNAEPLANGKLHIIDHEEGYIYFSKSTPQESVLLKMALDGNNQTELYKGKKSWSWINIIDGTLYLLDWNTNARTELYRYDPEEKDLFSVYGEES